MPLGQSRVEESEREGRERKCLEGPRAAVCVRVVKEGERLAVQLDMVSVRKRKEERNEGAERGRGRRKSVQTSRKANAYTQRR